MPVASLTSANTLQAWRLRVNDIISTKLDINTPNTAGPWTHSGLLSVSGRVAVTTNLSVSGNAAIGISSPSFLTNYSGVQINSSVGTELRLTNSTVGTSSSDGFALYCSTAGDGFVWNNENANLRFATNNTERMRIDSSGYVTINGTTVGWPAAGRGVLTINGPSSAILGLSVNGGSQGYLYHDGTNGYLNSINAIIFQGNGTERSRIDSSGNFVPGATNTYDLGSSSLRWRNIYTQDLHLSNGIGDYTVVEGEEDLFLVNNKTGKSFKFALIEVDPSQVPPKSET